MLHLRSVPSYPSWLARLRSELLPWNQGMDEEVTTTGPLKRSGVPRLTAVFFLSTTHLLMRVLVLTTVVPIHMPSYYSMISLLRGE
jgi:hypothetical protein